MRFLLTLAAALLPLLVWGCDKRSSVTGPSELGVPIQGQVLTFRTRTPMVGAVVQFRIEPFVESREARTDARGSYRISLQSIGYFQVWVNGTWSGYARVTGPSYRGDLLIDTGPCVARYGVIADAQTGRPVTGATVRVGQDIVVSRGDGWYFLDFGCPSSGTIGFNTTFMAISHPDYETANAVLGRGIQTVLRHDVNLNHR